MNQRIVFRSDASRQIGSGHVMRCLTLAGALRASGWECHFVCREHAGHLLAAIREQGFIAHILSHDQSHHSDADCDSEVTLAHAGWLGTSWQTDAAQTGALLADLHPHWLVVDHYALDQRWESALRVHCRKLMVIDDLADRSHQCDLLLDQNLGRLPTHYAGLVPQHCHVLAGPTFALLRPEFAALRDYSLQRRTHPQLKQLLITMGGVDRDNATGQVLNALAKMPLPADLQIVVIMGAAAPWLAEVQDLATRLEWPTEVLVDVRNIARHMADSDLAIGAAGGSTWERCCLGLPTMLVIVADNQRPGALALQRQNAAELIGEVSDIAQRLPSRLIAVTEKSRLSQLSTIARHICDGEGTARVVGIMEATVG